MQKAYGNILINNLDHKIKNLTQMLEAVFLDLWLQLNARSAIMFTIKLYFPTIQTLLYILEKIVGAFQLL